MTNRDKLIKNLSNKALADIMHHYCRMTSCKYCELKKLSIGACGYKDEDVLEKWLESEAKEMKAKVYIIEKEDEKGCLVVSGYTCSICTNKKMKQFVDTDVNIISDLEKEGFTVTLTE